MWLDRKLRDETDHYLALVKLEKQMKGKPFSDIRKAAAKTLTEPLRGRGFVRIVEHVAGYSVMFVDGAIVRKCFDPYFELGGHHLVYDYIPKDEVWIDAKTDQADWDYTVIHEIEEHKRMKKGMSYADAHDFALATERMARRKDGVADFFR